VASSPPSHSMAIASHDETVSVSSRAIPLPFIHSPISITTSATLSDHTRLPSPTVSAPAVVVIGLRTTCLEEVAHRSLSAAGVSGGADGIGGSGCYVGDAADAVDDRSTYSKLSSTS
jgi:hypothetical protein